MIKAVLGGGGKGMRIVEHSGEFMEKLEACKREASSSFGDDRVLLEKFISRPRHIEFQVFADKHGNTVHLFERDCSVQRRHQKVLEESPASGMTDELRAKMGKAAVNAVAAVGYVGAGTVEFMVDAHTDQFYYLETNTRLQVEHPVTEEIVKKDLVQLQLHVAAGYPLPFNQEDVSAQGHCIEARVYAENPQSDFLPCTGVISHLTVPKDHLGHTRVETGVVQGDEISVFYDPMIAKLVVWSHDRHSALREMYEALGQYSIVGLPTNIEFLRRAVSHPEFTAGAVETNFIENSISDLIPTPQSPPEDVFALGTLAVACLNQQKVTSIASQSSDPHSPWSSCINYRLNSSSASSMTWIFSVDNDTENVQAELVAERKSTFHVNINDKSFTASDLSIDAPTGQFECFLDGQKRFATVVGDQDGVDLFVDGERWRMNYPQVNTGEVHASTSGKMTAPMPGKIILVSVKPGDEVKKGDSLMVMEAMKMEHVIRASSDGTVDEAKFNPGDFVEGGAVLVTFKAADSEATNSANLSEP